MKFRLIATAAATMLLAACGGNNDASTEAEVDSVEMPADEALEGVTEAPVADPGANAEVTVPAEEGATEDQQIQDAGDNAAATAEAAMDAMEEESN